MPSTFSPLKIELPATGEQSGTWGNTTNTNLGTALEEAVVGSANVLFSSGNVTLTLTDTNASQIARNLRLNCTGVTGGSARTLTVPAIEKQYIVYNGCADIITIQNSTGTGVAVPAGKSMIVYNDGTNVTETVTNINSSVGALTVTSLTDSGLTSGRVTYAGTAGLLQDSANLTFNGTTLTANTLNLTNALGTAYGGTGLTALGTGVGTALGTNVGSAGAFVVNGGALGTPSSGTVTNLTGTASININGTVGATTPNTGSFTTLAYSSTLTGGTGVVNLGSGQFYKDASGNVGVGTTAPGYKIHTLGTTSAGGILVEDSDASSYSPAIVVVGKREDNNGAQAFTGRIALAKNRTDAAVAANNSLGTIYFGGNHTNNSGGNIAYAASIMGIAQGAFNSSSDMPSALAFYTGVAGVALDSLSSAGTERMRIDSSGSVGIGTSSPSSYGNFVINQTSGYAIALIGGTLTGSQAWRHWLGNTGTSSYYIFNDGNTGVYLAYGATSWAANSDERLKTDLLPITDAANKVCTLRTVTGRYKTDEEGTSRAFLIAQDVQKVLPEAISVGENEMLGVQYTDVIPLLVAAIQEQQAMIETLTTRLNALEGK